MRSDIIKIKNIIEAPISGEWGEDGGDIKVLRSTNFNNDGTLNLSNVITRNVPAKKVELKSLLSGDSIIEKSGGSPTQPVGRVVYFDIPNETYLCNNFTSIIRPTARVHPKYLFWLLFNNHRTGKTLRYQNKTTGIINLQLERYLNESEVQLPPLPIQEHIANTLDIADALRKKDQQLLQKYDELAQSIFIEMFGDLTKNKKGWEARTLESICDVGSGKRVFVDELVEKGIPFYRGTEIGMMAVGKNVNPTLFITTEHYEKLKEFTGVPQIGDLLMPSICPDGRIYEVNHDKPFYFKDGRVLWIKNNRSLINSKYLKTFLKFMFFNNYHKIASGTTFAELKIISLKKILVLLPPISLQNQFASIVDNLNHSRIKGCSQLTYSEDLFNSLHCKFFGK